MKKLIPPDFFIFYRTISSLFIVRLAVGFMHETRDVYDSGLNKKSYFY